MIGQDIRDGWRDGLYHYAWTTICTDSFPRGAGWYAMRKLSEREAHMQGPFLTEDAARQFISRAIRDGWLDGQEISESDVPREEASAR